MVVILVIFTFLAGFALEGLLRPTPQFQTFVEFVRYSKIHEYAFAFAMMGSFLLFYKLLNREKGKEAPVPALQPSILDRVKGFLVPQGYSFHLGHSWVRTLADGLALVGIDDFARKLVGPIQALILPPAGTYLRQGERAFSLVANGRTLDVISPVDGEILGLNERVRLEPGMLQENPYDAQWLLKIRPENWSGNRRNLLSGESVKRWFADSLDRLMAFSSPELGAMAADGGLPGDSLAQAVDPQNWENLAQLILLNEEKPGHTTA